MPRRTALDRPPSARVQPSLSRERLLVAAIALADRDGIESLSMRKLAQQLGFDPMSLYNHVRSKEDLLDGIADTVVGRDRADHPAADWKASMRQTILEARGTLLRHPWAPTVIESRRRAGSGDHALCRYRASASSAGVASRWRWRTTRST